MNEYKAFMEMFMFGYFVQYFQLQRIFGDP